MATAPSPVGTPEVSARRRPPRWAPIAIVVAVAVVAVALVVGVRGLVANPVKGTAPDGTTVIQGSYEPYSCCPPRGYVQAGARSVFVILPTGCPAPRGNSDVTVHARLDPSQGTGAYRATGCASPG